ncbi:spore gernimation protein GerPD [Neobacillus drentensis]|uniref:spore gernimation protein GerPD n=1 Tax=Neobacillus drentensis TaxID=220684 RepID=UPI003000DA01
MNFVVYNRELFVQNIKITGVSSSSLVMVGDTETIQLASTFDTPAESLIISPFVPLSLE